VSGKCIDTYTMRRNLRNGSGVQSLIALCGRCRHNGEDAKTKLCACNLAITPCRLQVDSNNSATSIEAEVEKQKLCDKLKCEMSVNE